MTRDVLEIRFARPEDLAVLVEIEDRSFPDPWKQTMLRSEIASAFGFQLLARLREEEVSTVGYAAFRAIGVEAELLRLAVVPEARGRGIGRELVERGLARLATEGVTSCFLEVRETNLPAIRLYEALGFERTGRRVAYYRDRTDALVYRRGVGAP